MKWENQYMIKKLKNSRKREVPIFSHNQPYGMNDLSLGNSQGKEKQQDMIDVMYQIFIEQKEKLRKIKEIKSFFYELSSFSSSLSLQQPNIITSLIQTPIIQPIIPPVHNNAIAANTTATRTTITRTKKEGEY